MDIHCIRHGAIGKGWLVRDVAILHVIRDESTNGTVPAPEHVPRLRGDRLRDKRTENGGTFYYFRSSILGWQVLAEFNQNTWTYDRAYVYEDAGKLLALQQNGAVEWVHADPVTKSQRLTNNTGQPTAVIETEPWGSEVSALQTPSFNQAKQPQRYTSYIRDGNGHDEAMHRRYQAGRSRFFQPDPYDGSYSLGDPQSFNRYAYVGNDPVNRTDPSGLDWDDDAFAELDAAFDNISGGSRSGGGGGSGFGGYGSSFGIYANSLASSPEERQHEQRVQNGFWGNGYRTNAEVGAAMNFDINYTLYSDGSYTTGFAIGVNVGLSTWQRFQDRTVNFTVGLTNAVSFSAVEWGIEYDRRNGIPHANVDLSSGAAQNGAMMAVVVPGPGGKVKTGSLIATHALTQSRRAIQRLINDIAKNGIREPIKYAIYNGERYIVDGHHRVHAAMRLGIREVPAQEVSLPFRGYRTVDDFFR